jgi:hypothetical protein
VRFVLGTYARGVTLTGAEALEWEQERSREWNRSHGPGDLDARRRAVTERGRTQL